VNITNKVIIFQGGRGEMRNLEKTIEKMRKRRYESIEKGNMAARKFDMNEVYSDNEIIKILRDEGYSVIGLVEMVIVFHYGIPVGDNVRLMFEKREDGMYQPYFDPSVEYKLK